MKQLEGKVIVIGNALTPIGSLLARTLVREGALVALGTAESCPAYLLKDELGASAIVVEYNNSLEFDASLLFQEVKRTFGNPDSYVHEFALPPPALTEYLNQQREDLYAKTLVPPEIMIGASAAFMQENGVRGTNIFITPEMDPRMPLEERITLPAALARFDGIKSKYRGTGIEFIRYIKPFKTEEQMTEDLKNLVLTGKLS